MPPEQDRILQEFHGTIGNDGYREHRIVVRLYEVCNHGGGLEGSHLFYSSWIPFSTSEYDLDMLHAMVVDESMTWAGGWDEEFSFALYFCRGGQHLPVGGGYEYNWLSESLGKEGHIE